MENAPTVSTKKNCVLLVSGGIDSTTMLAQLTKQGYNVVSVFIDYGQENINPTLTSAMHYTKLYNSDLKLVKLNYEWSKASIIKGNYIDENITEENVYSVDVKALSWVPARNANMLLMAGGIASEMNIKEVYCSFQFDKSEWKTYDELRLKCKFPAADLSPRFLLYMNKLANFCYKTKVVFKAPYIKERLDCKEIVQKGKEINVDYSKTYSCRYCINGKPCGKCEQCVIRKQRLSNV